jgi:hypothetical protein
MNLRERLHRKKEFVRPADDLQGENRQAILLMDFVHLTVPTGTLDPACRSKQRFAYCLRQGGHPDETENVFGREYPRLHAFLNGRPFLILGVDLDRQLRQAQSGTAPSLSIARWDRPKDQQVAQRLLYQCRFRYCCGRGSGRSV